MRLELGCPVCCADGPAGELADVVVDPVKRRVTHLVVQPSHRHDLARLAPVELATIEDGSDPAVRLACTTEELSRLEQVEELAYVRVQDFPLADPEWDVGAKDMLALPYFDSERVGSGLEADPHVAFTYDRIPKGEVEIRRTSEVVSADGRILGHVDGFLVDADEHITHVVLERGHLWGRREVTIPLGAVARVETDSIRLALTKDAVGALPSLSVRRRHR